MTTIVGDARTGTLGGDSYCSAGYRSAKLFRTKKQGIFGCAGDDTAIARFEDWLLHDGKKPAPIDSASSEGFEALQLHKGRLYIWGAAMRPELLFHPFAENGAPIPAHFAAIGTGAPYALGCLAQGGTIHEALRIAELYDSNSRGPFQVMKEAK